MRSRTKDQRGHREKKKRERDGNGVRGSRKDLAKAHCRFRSPGNQEQQTNTHTHTQKRASLSTHTRAYFFSPLFLSPWRVCCLFRLCACALSLFLLLLLVLPVAVSFSFFFFFFFSVRRFGWKRRPSGKWRGRTCEAEDDNEHLGKVQAKGRRDGLNQWTMRHLALHADRRTDTHTHTHSERERAISRGRCTCICDGMYSEL